MARMAATSAAQYPSSEDRVRGFSLALKVLRWKLLEWVIVCRFICVFAMRWNRLGAQMLL